MDESKTRGEISSQWVAALPVGIEIVIWLSVNPDTDYSDLGSRI